MGMAASQARLLTITARLADNELRSQTINNAKMRLAAQSSQASEKYINALNNATYRFASYDEAGNSMSQDLTYNALTAYSSYNTQYGLINSAGQILVSESEAAMFTQANGNLNAYLLAHGLEYTTTYFDELGAVKNPIYPSPFDSIGVDELKTAYEQYGSYENSLEVENFQNNYSVFMHAQNNLVKGAEDVLETYLGYSSNPKLSSGEDGFTLDYAGYSGLSNVLNRFKNAFTVNNNTYNINHLKNYGIISETLAQTLIDEKVNGLKYVSSAPYTESGEVKYKAGVEFAEKTDISVTPGADDSREYLLDESIKVIVDADGNVTSVDLSILTSGAEGGESYTQTGPLDDDGNVVTDGWSFEDFVNEFSYKHEITNDDGSISTAEYFFDLSKSGSDYELTSKRYIFDEAQLKNELNDYTNDIVNAILSQANYENFADILVDMSVGNWTNPYGIGFAVLCAVAGDNLEDTLNEYQAAKNQFLNNIFDEHTPVRVNGVNYTSSKDYIEQAMKQNEIAFNDENGDPVLITPDNLTDIDFVLRLLKEKGLTQSESFNTVIKEFLVGEIITVYGEPKYAWVDANDTTNTGNADAKAQWYTNLFTRMNQGFKALENGLGSSKEWIEYALESGIVTLEQVDKNFKWNGLDFKTCIKITEETDDAAVTKAEAEYNRAMNDIKAKDNIYTLELKNIDTEHNALQTEYDVIKGVIDKNISRTFKFNQSA